MTTKLLWIIMRLTKTVRALEYESVTGKNKLAKRNNNKKFWEDLIAYFTFIRHGLHTKRRAE
jgi:hypothetical protein